MSLTKRKMPDSARRILLEILERGPLAPHQIIESLKDVQGDRATRYALKFLRKNNLAKRIPNLLDMRTSFYTLLPEIRARVDELYNIGPRTRRRRKR